MNEQGPTQAWRQGYAVGCHGERDKDPMLAAWPGSDVEWSREHQLGWEAGRAARRRARQEEHLVDVERRRRALRAAFEEDDG